MERVSRVGVLGIGMPTERSARFQLFQQELRDLGYVEGRNIAFEFRWVEGSAEQLVAAAGGLVDLKVDLIVATSSPAAMAAQKVTRAVPVVFVTAADPVGSGLVASIGRPGGNVTGVSLLTPEIVGRQMQLLKEALPRTSRVVVLSNPSNQYDASLVREVESAARSMGIRIRVLGVPASEALEGTFAAAAKERADALFVLFDPLMFTHRARIADFASRRRLPLMAPHREYAEAGGLMAYGADLRDNYRRAAGYVDRILKGAKPTDLPVEQPTKFELVINLKTAKALGLTIPPSVLLRADQVIE